ncbi:hypothetical protein [Hyphomicrobium sp.]|uniref:hypothetical protein n=1 Tax=Hyphomicrobium sp. TaxID=82 RepID=UPI000F93F218|nr:hypothetical protein [Hyphomicrobium sp.]RUP00441.1 MAG: hypothetical protein EKK30_01530 [Hyphomicrobium sp.]
MVSTGGNAGWNEDAEHPATRFAADCALQLDVCNSLLAVADALPAGLNVKTLEVLSKLTPVTWTSHLALQNEAIIPLIVRRQEQPEAFLARFDPFARQHIEISSLNDELVDFFRAISGGERVENNMIGYLIRSVADRRREHVEWERVLLGPLLPQTLAPAERRMFMEWSAANPWPYDDFKRLSISNLN